jgi:hypothetical protein
VTGDAPLSRDHIRARLDLLRDAAKTRLGLAEGDLGVCDDPALAEALAAELAYVMAERRLRAALAGPAVAPVSPSSVRCPRCGASVGDPCRTPGGATTGYHAVRRTAVTR